MRSRCILILFVLQMMCFPEHGLSTELLWGTVVDLDAEKGELGLRMIGASEKSEFHRNRSEIRYVVVRFDPEDLPDDIRPGVVANVWGEPIPGNMPAFAAAAIKRVQNRNADATGVRSRLGRAGRNGYAGGAEGDGGGHGHGGGGSGGGGSGGGGSGGGGGGGGGGGRR